MKKATGRGLQVQVYCWWMCLVNPSAALQYLDVKRAVKCRGTCPGHPVTCRCLSVSKECTSTPGHFQNKIIESFCFPVAHLVQWRRELPCVLMQASIQEKQSSLMPTVSSANLQWDREIEVWFCLSCFATQPGSSQTTTSVHCQHTGHLKHHSQLTQA